MYGKVLGGEVGNALGSSGPFGWIAMKESCVCLGKGSMCATDLGTKEENGFWDMVNLVLPLRFWLDMTGIEKLMGDRWSPCGMS